MRKRQRRFYETAQQLLRQPRLEPAHLDPERLRKLRVVASDPLDEALGILAADEDLERMPERERR